MAEIAVIIPCYNQAQWLGDALQSLIDQSFSDWEAIIVNDGSTDDTEAVAAEWMKIDDRIRYLSQANKGLAGARNTGIRHSNAGYILPLDADDKIAPGYLEKALRVFENDPATALVYGRAEYFGAATGPWPLPPYQYGLLFFQNPLYCSAVFRRSDWQRAGGYSEDLRAGLEDWDFWLKMLEPKSKVAQLPETMFYYRRRSGSMINTLTADPGGYQAFLQDMLARHSAKFREWAGGHLRFLMEDNEARRRQEHRLLKHPLARILYKAARTMAGKP